MGRWGIVLRGIVLVAIVAGRAWAADFRLTSPVIKEQAKLGDEQVYNGFGCKGANISPELRWEHAPKDVRSFAVTVYDPDAPTGSGWWHWVIFNIPPSVQSLPRDAGKPNGGKAPADSVQSVTDFGQPGYGGPCPPPGDKPHRYLFTVYALKVDQLPLKTDAPGAMVGFYLNQNKLATATVTGTYGR